MAKPSNPQYGGWYDGQQWDGTRYGPVGQVIVGQNAQNPNSFDSIYNTAAGQENKYIDQLMGTYQGQLDLALKKLDAEHKLALGNDDTEQAKFLESVANNLESQIGRFPYDYQKYTNRELQDYALKNKDIATSRADALNKLNNDEMIAKRDLGFQQGKDNQSLAENLNSRGLMYGQQPTGMGANNTGTEQDLGGLTGLAGQQAGLQNTAYGNQFNTIDTTNNLQRTATNNQFDLQQAQTDFAHQNNLLDLTDDARRDAQDAANAYTFGTQEAQNEFNMQKQALERQRQQLLQQDKINAINQAGKQNGILGF